MKPVIVTLEPMADGSESTTTVATFEEAFGEHSYAWGKKKKSADDKKSTTTPSATPKDKPKKDGFFSKEKREARKEKRVERRVERRANRKAKYGARPLKTFVHNGVQKFKDKLPKLRKNKKANGEVAFEKTMPDGTVKEIPKSQVKTIPSAKGGEENHFDMADVNTQKAVVQTVLDNGEVELSKLYNQEETETIPNEQGVDTVYKKEDVADSGDASTTSSSSTGMSKGMKIGLIVGGTALVLGIVAFVIYKSKQGKGK